MSIIPSPSGRQMKNKTFLVQYSDEILTKSISHVQEGKFCSWAGIIGPFSNMFRVQCYWWLLSCGFFRWLPVASFSAMLVCFMLLSSLVQICSCTLPMSTPNTYPKTFDVHMSKWLSLISTIASQEYATFGLRITYRVLEIKISSSFSNKNVS